VSQTRKSENWSSRLGVILAVAGSAVGLGNFLRFPGLAAQYGSGAFMIAYFISLVIIGFPICWAEWTLGRYAGQQGFHSSPGIFGVLIRNRWGKFIGVLGVIIPVIIYMYYVYIEAWCAGYAWYFAWGELNLGDDPTKYSDFWESFIGFGSDGFLLGAGRGKVIWFLLAVFTINFIIIYRGLARGIEMFCKFAMPALILLALVILVRVLTLGTPDASKPDQNVGLGLGSMWNPERVFLQEKIDSPKASAGFVWTNREEVIGPAAMAAAQARISEEPNLRLQVRTVWDQLRNPQLWLAAAGQIFFSLSVGFGVIITYSSYLRETDDVVLSGLTASSANEFCEVALGGMITVPAAYVFLGVAGIAGQGTFGLGFNVLPVVFAQMPMPALFGFMFFFLLFLAAVTSSLSMLQPGIAFLEEGLGLNRRQSVTLLGMLTSIGCLFVVYFSKDIKALDTIDFWVGTVFIFILATVTIIVFGWVVGVEKGWTEAHKGAEIRIPAFFKFIMKFVSPVYLLVIFGLFVWYNVIGYNGETGEFNPTSYVTDLVGEESNSVAQLSIGLVLIVITFFLMMISLAGKRWESERTPTAATIQPNSSDS
jgi:SNF family Na+-dependent transporter